MVYKQWHISCMILLKINQYKNQFYRLLRRENSTNTSTRNLFLNYIYTTENVLINIYVC